jgi:Co/Zn/Cd efflux system component
MSGCGCGSVCNTASPDPGYRRALWVALVLNALMFGVELVASFQAQSVSLLADAVDFLGDAGNYGVA